jgi:putative tryptophan/tyrosine transport system substrate-binding protein
MRRREFIAGFGAAAAWTLAARAQQPDRMRRIGILMSLAEDDPDSQVRLTSLLRGLDRLGWTVSRNLVVDYRWNIIDVERARAAATDLLALAPDVFLAYATPAVQGVQSVTRTVPTVFTVVTEPVAQGFIESLAHPGGNLTGFSYLPPTVGGKWLELLKEIAPQVTRVAYIIYPPGSPYGGLFYGSIQLAAGRYAVQTLLVPVYEPGEFEPVMAKLGGEPGGGLIVDPDALTAIHRKLIIELAARYRLPAVYHRRFFATDGGLVYYGVDDVEHNRQVAAYIDRILRGEKPADLPVQAPTKYETVINLKTAKALGLTIPETLLATADEVIQ